MILPSLPLFVLAITLVVLVWWLVRLAAQQLTKRGVLDVPNERSSHTQPTPRGAGLVLIPCLCAAWAMSYPLTGTPIAPEFLVAIAGVSLLSMVSWRDDQRPISPIIRFVAQWVAVSGVLFIVPLPGLVFQGILPPAFDVVGTALLWVWFINVYNFLDGIDGITAVQTASIGLGVVFVTGLGHVDAINQAHGLMLVGASIGFLRWNWHPATIFLGDIGSIGLGFLVGWLLITIAALGHPIPALILVLYYLGDATLTLIQRAIRREKIWQAHREHFYQRAVQTGQTHAQVSAQVFILNLGLIGCACVATLYPKPWIGLVLAFIMVAMTLAHFQRRQP